MTTMYGADPVLRTYLRLMRKRAWWIALAVLVGLAAGLGLALTSAKQYSATAEILVQPVTSASGTNPIPVTMTDVQTDIQLVTSAPVQQAVTRTLGSAPSVSAAQVAQTNVIAITAVSTSPEFAARAANNYASAFVSYEQKIALASLTAAEAQLRRQASSLDPEIAALRRKPSQAARLAALLNQQAVEKQQLAQMQVTAAGGSLGGMSLVTPAVVPASPSSPKPIQEGTLGLAVGLVLGIGMAFLLESFDDSLTSKDAAERFGGAPVLAMVPVIPSWKRRDRAQVVSISLPLSPAAEAYRSLRTSVQFLRQDREVRTLLVTSAAASEGKSATVANLGVAFAQAGERVLMISGDLRRPRLGDFFGMDESRRGFTAMIRGDQSLASAIQQVAGFDTLWLLGAGAVPVNPAELLGSRRAYDLFARLRTEFDLILIDSPPVLPVTDAVVLSKYADATVIVCSSGQTKRPALQRAAENLSQVNATVVGLVLGEVSREHGYGYGYGHGYEGEYSQRVPDQRRSEAPRAMPIDGVRAANGVPVSEHRHA